MDEKHTQGLFMVDGTASTSASTSSSILWDPHSAFTHTHADTHANEEEESMSQSYPATADTAGDNHSNLFSSDVNGNSDHHSNNPSSEAVKEVKEISNNNDNDNNNNEINEEVNNNNLKSTTSAAAAAASSSSFSVDPFSVNVPLNALHPTTHNNATHNNATVVGGVSMDVNATMASSYASFHPPAPVPAPSDGMNVSNNTNNYNTNHNDHVGCNNSSVATSSNNAFAILDAVVPNFSTPSNASNNFASKRLSQLQTNNVAPINTSGSNSVSTLAVLHDAMMHHANAVNDFSCNYSNHDGVGSKVTDKMDALSTNHNANDAHALLIEQVLLANKSNLKSKNDNISHSNTTDGTPQQQSQQQQQQCIRRPLTASNQKNERTWFEKLEQLRQFRTEHGHANVPQKYTANPQLGTWVHKQRAQYANYRRGKPSQITIERIHLMEAAGVQFPEPTGMLPRDNFVTVSSNIESIQKGMFLTFDIKH